MQAQSKQQPIKRFSTGTIQASVWKKEHQTQEKKFDSFSVLLDKRYRDKDGQWQSTNFFRAEDLPKAKMLLDEAYRFLTLKPENDE